MHARLGSPAPSSIPTLHGGGSPAEGDRAVTKGAGHPPEEGASGNTPQLQSSALRDLCRPCPFMLCCRKMRLREEKGFTPSCLGELLARLRGKPGVVGSGLVSSYPQTLLGAHFCLMFICWPGNIQGNALLGKERYYQEGAVSRDLERPGRGGLRTGMASKTPLRPSPEHAVLTAPVEIWVTGVGPDLTRGRGAHLPVQPQRGSQGQGF